MTAPIGISWADPLNVSSVQLKLLSEDTQWRALLHYDQLVSRISPNSRAAESDFFLSEAGKTDPRAELEATLRAMLSAEPLDDTHAICRFPARFLWLSKKSELTSLLFPKPACQRFRQWYDAISAQGITLIFPASFVNNPASAFGHTFLRLDHGSADDDTRLLDYAADFAAATHGENALLYAIKGIFGGFDGFFSVGPFYKKVEKYSDLENRDIWEYHLNLNRDEVSMLTYHLWELREKPFSYFYFDENCSYHILALLDVARPSLGLIQSMRLWVIPIDTIREIQGHPGLVDKVVFRASAATKLHGRIDQTASSAQTMALKAADYSQDLDKSIEENSGSPENLASALDLGYDFLTYQRIRTRSDSVEEKQRAWKLLAARSSLPPAKALEYPVPVVRAENGHKTAMLSLGVGRSEDRGISEFVFRPAFHSLSDPLGGYLPGNQIKFFETHAILFPAHIDTFALGMCIATATVALEAFPHLKVRRSRLAQMSPIFFFMSAATWFWSTQIGWGLDFNASPFRVELFGHFLYGISSFCLILPFCLDQGDSRIVKIMSSQILVWLGTISYGMYLWHFLFLDGHFANTHLPYQISDMGIATRMLITIPCSITLASISYYLIERPLLRTLNGSIRKRKILS